MHSNRKDWGSKKQKTKQSLPPQKKKKTLVVILTYLRTFKFIHVLSRSWHPKPTSIMTDLSPSHSALCMPKMALASCSPEQDEDYVAEPITHIIFSIHLHTWQRWLSQSSRKVNLIFKEKVMQKWLLPAWYVFVSPPDKQHPFTTRVFVQTLFPIFFFLLSLCSLSKSTFIRSQMFF